MDKKLLLRRDTTTNWTTINPVLALGEPGFDTTLKVLKIGDGVSTWTTLPLGTQVNADWNATSGVAQILNKPNVLTPYTSIVAFENLLAGDFVSVISSSGIKVRKADGATPGLEADGFVLANVTAGGTAQVFPSSQINTAMTGMTPGAPQYLSVTVPGKTQETAPAYGAFSQYLGTAEGTTNLYFEAQPPLYLVRPPFNTTAPVISGSINQGQTLSTTNGIWGNLANSYTYQWFSGNTPISGATANSYVLTGAEVGLIITCSVTAINYAGSATTVSNALGPILSAVVAPTNVSLPVVTGSTVQGQVLTTTQGTWNNSPTSYTYQWLRAGVNISGATSSTYTSVSGDIGSTISCKVTASNAGGSNNVTSASIGPVTASTLAPTISVAPVLSGAPLQGNTLSVTNGTWNNTPTSYTYQWKRGVSAISGATANTYTLVSGDVSLVILCTVTATNSAGSSSADSNSVTALIPVPTIATAPVVTGTASIGSTLTTTTGSWNYSPSTYAYQWLSAGQPITGATSTTYVITSLNAGNSVVCSVTATNSSGASIPASSNAIGPIVVPVTGVTVDKTSITGVAGGTNQLTITYSPSNATTKTGTWSSSATGVATVNSSGLVTFIATGTATITFTSTSGGFTATTGVTTSAPILAYDFEADTVGSFPSQMTNLFGTSIVVLTPTVTSYVHPTGKVLGSNTTVTNDSAVAQFDLWGDPIIDDQVMTWRHWNVQAGSVDVRIGLRMQTTRLGPTPGTAAYALRQGYYFSISSPTNSISVYKQGGSNGNGYVPMATYTLPSTLSSGGTNSSTGLTFFRASAITESGSTRLKFEYSTDGSFYTTGFSYLDTVQPFLTSATRPLYVENSYQGQYHFQDGYSLTSSIISVVHVTGVAFTTTSPNTGIQGVDFQTAWTVTPSNATFPTVSFSSSDASVAYIDSSGVLKRVSPGTCIITVAGTEGTTGSLTVNVTDALGNVPSMRLGVNGWNKSWQPDNTYFDTPYLTGGASVGAWATATLSSTTKLANFNPWSPQLLTDMSLVSGPIRFMDLNNTNASPIELWSERMPMAQQQAGGASHPITIANYLRSDTAGATLGITGFTTGYTYYNSVTTATWNLADIAYEWMIDLCNRTGRDMWINIPAFANEAFQTSLATLISTYLRSDLKCYVEYSNEYWNFISAVNQYSQIVGPALTSPAVLPVSNDIYYKGFAWCFWKSLTVFKNFRAVFGNSNTGFGKRLCRVFAMSNNVDFGEQSLKNICYDGSGTRTTNSLWNPTGEVPDMLAVAPYVGRTNPSTGTSYDASAVGYNTSFHTEIVNNLAGYMAGFKALGVKWGLPLGLYEFGQDNAIGADSWARNPLIYDEYTFFFDGLNAMGVKVGCHYNWVGSYSSSGAWGLKNATNDSNAKATSPKMASVIDWVAIHP